jgi:hypothetical protein
MVREKEIEPIQVHHHGEASTSDMDGWAEQFLCAGEAKVGCGTCRRPHQHCRHV